MKKDLTVGSPLKLIILFTAPLLIGNIFQQLYNTADTMIVGRTISLDALAAVGVTGSLVFFVIGFAQGLTGGFSIITAQKFGNKDMEGVRRSVAASIILSAIITVILTIISVILAGYLLHIIRTPLELYDMAYDYIIVIFWGTGAAIFFNLFSNVLRAIGNSKWPLYFLIVACIVNIALDYILILYFHMGVAGAGLATVISQIIASLLCFEYIRRFVPELQARGSDWKITKKDVLRLIPPPTNSETMKSTTTCFSPVHSCIISSRLPEPSSADITVRYFAPLCNEYSNTGALSQKRPRNPTHADARNSLTGATTCVTSLPSMERYCRSVVLLSYSNPKEVHSDFPTFSKTPTPHSAVLRLSSPLMDMISKSLLKHTTVNTNIITTLNRCTILQISSPILPMPRLFSQ